VDQSVAQALAHNTWPVTVAQPVQGLRLHSRVALRPPPLCLHRAAVRTILMLITAVRAYIPFTTHGK